MSSFQHRCTVAPTLEVSASIAIDEVGEPYVQSIDIGRENITRGHLFNALSPLILETIELQDLQEAA